MIDPRGLTLTDWADSVLLALRNDWQFGSLLDESQWQSWASQFLRAAATGRRVPPDPYQFTDWREWAMRAYPMLEID